MKKTGSMNHVRFTVSYIPRGGLLRPALAFHGLRARREERGALGLEDAPRRQPTMRDPERGV